MEKSEKRKFSRKRLYKLAKRIVIVIAVLASLWFIFSIYIYNFELDEIYSRNMTSCGGFPKAGSADLAWEFYGSCVDKADSVEKFWVNSLMFSPLVAFGLPIIFFGSVGVYRYLFPKNKMEKM